MPALLQSLAALSLALSAYAQTPAPPSVESLIDKWATNYGVSSSTMNRLMKCESGGNPQALNPTDPNGGSKGLFQYQTNTFNLWAKEIGETRDIWDAEAQIRLTAYALSQNRQSHWSCFKILRQVDSETGLE